MCKQPSYEPFSPVKRVVENEGIYFGGEHFKHDELRVYEGNLVLCDLEKDMDTEKLNFRVYAASGKVICLLEIDSLTEEQICPNDYPRVKDPFNMMEKSRV